MNFPSLDLKTKALPFVRKTTFILVIRKQEESGLSGKGRGKSDASPLPPVLCLPRRLESFS